MTTKGLGFGIIGCGTAAEFHAKALGQLSGDARLVAVSDVDLARAIVITQMSGGGVSLFTEYRDMLKRPDIDAVCLCVPSGMRLEIGMACAKAGKHMLCEKPLEVSIERADALIAAAREADVKLGCIFQYRFTDAAKCLKQAVEAGRFGKLIAASAHVMWHRGEEYYASAKWRGTKNLDGGGVLINQAIHYIDLMCWLMGPVSVLSALTACLNHPGLQVEDTAAVSLRFKSGAVGTIMASTATCEPGRPARLEIHGTAGDATIENGQLVYACFEDAQPIQIEAGQATTGNGTSSDPAALDIEPHRRQIADFVAAIQDNRQPLVNGWEARRAVGLIEAIYESAPAGQLVNF